MTSIHSIRVQGYASDRDYIIVEGAFAGCGSIRNGVALTFAEDHHGTSRDGGFVVDWPDLLAAVTHVAKQRGLVLSIRRRARGAKEKA